MSDRLAVRKTYKLYVNAPSRARSPAAPTRSPTPRATSSPTPPGPPARTPGTPSSAPSKWSGMTAYNRGQVLYRVAEVMEGRHAQFCDEVAAGEGLSSSKARPPSTPPSTAGSGTPGGPTSWPPSSAGPTRSPGRTSTSRCPSRPASSPSWRRRSPRCSAWSACSRRCWRRATPPSSSRRRRGAAGAVTLGEVLATSDVPGGVVNLLTGDAAELGPGWPSTPTSTST